MAGPSNEPPSHMLLLPPLPSATRDVPALGTLCLDRVSAEPAACLASVSRGHGWHLLGAPLRLQLLSALGERHALSDPLLERLLPGGTVKEAAQKQPALETLCLAECAQVTERGMAAVAQRCPALRSLSVVGLSLGDAPLALVGACCTQLHTLRLARCRRLSESCVKQLAEALPLLTEVRPAPAPAPAPARLPRRDNCARRQLSHLLRRARARGSSTCRTAASWATWRWWRRCATARACRPSGSTARACAASCPT